MGLQRLARARKYDNFGAFIPPFLIEQCAELRGQTYNDDRNHVDAGGRTQRNQPLYNGKVNILDRVLLAKGAAARDVAKLELRNRTI